MYIHTCVYIYIYIYIHTCVCIIVWFKDNTYYTVLYYNIAEAMMAKVPGLDKMSGFVLPSADSNNTNHDNSTTTTTTTTTTTDNNNNDESKRHNSTITHYNIILYGLSYTVISYCIIYYRMHIISSSFFPAFVSPSAEHVYDILCYNILSCNMLSHSIIPQGRPLV